MCTRCARARALSLTGPGTLHSAAGGQQQPARTQHRAGYGHQHTPHTLLICGEPAVSGGGVLKWSDDKVKVEYYKSSNECCSGHHPWRATGWLGCRAVRPPWPGAGCARPARLERGLAGPPLPSSPPSITEQTGDCRVICAAGRGRGRPVSGLETRYWISTQIAAECDTGTREVQELGSIVTTDVATWCELHWNCS